MVVALRQPIRRLAGLLDRPSSERPPTHPPPRPSATSGDGFLELDFGGEAVAITPDRQHRQFSAALPVSHGAVPRRKAPVNLDPVPMRGVPDIIELQIVLLGPEERYRVE